MNEIKITGGGFVRLLDHMGSDVSIVNGARISYNKRKQIGSLMDEKDTKLVKRLMKDHHTSTLEHTVFSFHIKCPLYIRSQWHRHRTWSYSEISRRYTNVDISFFEIEDGLRLQSSNNKQASIEEYHPKSDYYKGELRLLQKRCLDLYNLMVDDGICKEDSRGILPQFLMTEFYGTVNLNNLLKFIKLRYPKNAQWLMQLYAKALMDLAEPIVPVAMEYFRENILKE